MAKQSLSLPFLTALLAFPLACTREPAPELELPLVRGDSPLLEADGKADRPDLALSRVEDSMDFAPELRQILTSAAQYEAVFGHAPPADLDFEREWAFFYSVGPDWQPGQQAGVARVRLSDSGRTLLVTTSLEIPGDGCDAAGGAPQVLVKFARPAERPLHARQYHERTERHCAGPCAELRCEAGTRCAAALVQQQGPRASCVAVEAAPPSCADHQCVGFERCVEGDAGPACVAGGPSPLCEQTRCAEGERCVGSHVHATCVAFDQCHRDGDCGPGQLCGVAFRCLHSNCVAPLVCQEL